MQRYQVPFSSFTVMGLYFWGFLRLEWLCRKLVVRDKIDKMQERGN